jgi:predicted acylesterase/phospholipase RssA
LGPDCDDALGEAYLSIRGDADIFSDNKILGFIFGDALSSTAPLRKRLDRSITPQMIAKVAEEARQGRRLYVGSVGLDDGTFKPWDLTAIALQGGEAARQRYIDALMASTAIPVAFPPMVIDGVAYVDGGTRRNIFLQVVAEEAERLKRNEASAPTRTTVYSLVNGMLDVGHQNVKRKVLDIAKRSVDILLDESTGGNLFRIYLLAQKKGFEFQMAKIPPKACPVEGSAENQFDPNLMKCLYAEGVRYARDEAEPWKNEPPFEDAKP